MKLYQIVDEYQEVTDWIADHGEEIADAGGELPEELSTLLDKFDSDLRGKVERIALMIQTKKAHAAAVKLEADRLVARQRSIARQAESLTNYLHRELTRAGVRKIDGDLVNIAIQMNSRPSIGLQYPDVIPEQWKKTTVSFDSQAAYQAMKEAGELDLDPGETKEVAGLTITAGTHLRIR